MSTLAYIAGIVALTLMSTVICYLDLDNDRLLAENIVLRCQVDEWQKITARLVEERDMLQEQLENKEK